MIGEADVGLEEWQVDINEKASVTALIEVTCDGKKKVDSWPCSSQFIVDHLSVQAYCSELTHYELEMVVMGQLITGMKDDPTTNPLSRNKGKDRQKVTYNVYDKPACESVPVPPQHQWDPIQESEESALKQMSITVSW